MQPGITLFDVSFFNISISFLLFGFMIFLQHPCIRHIKNTPPIITVKMYIIALKKTVMLSDSEASLLMHCGQCMAFRHSLKVLRCRSE